MVLKRQRSSYEGRSRASHGKSCESSAPKRDRIVEPGFAFQPTRLSKHSLGMELIEAPRASAGVCLLTRVALRR